jgi:hypothetical protein
VTGAAFALELRLRARSFLLAGLGLMSVAAITGALFPAFGESLGKVELPEGVGELLGGGDFASIAGWLNTEIASVYGPLVVAGSAIAAAAATIAGEEERRVLALVLAHPVSRTRLLLAKAAAIALLVAALIIAGSSLVTRTKEKRLPSGGNEGPTSTSGPDVDERLLGGVLGEMAVAQDAVRRLVEPRVTRDGQRLERPLVPPLCPKHEVVVHAFFLVGRPPSDRREERTEVGPLQGTSGIQANTCPSSLGWCSQRPRLTGTEIVAASWDRCPSPCMYEVWRHRPAWSIRGR